MLEIAGESVKREIANPGFGPGAGMPRMQWVTTVGSIKRINSTAYKDRPINLEAVDSSYLGFPAPGEENLKGDVEKARNYRIAHYLKVTAIRQTDTLIADMSNELRLIEMAIVNTPEGKALR